MPFLDAVGPFICGGLSGCCATTVIQPVDTVKVRIQLSPTPVSPIALGREIIRKEGARALYSGLDSAILRQVLYGTTRLGLFRYY